MAGIDVASLVSGQNASIANAQSQMASDYSQVNDLANSIVSATQQQGTDEATIATQQAQGLLQAQQAARQVAASYGGNPDDVSFIMNKLGQQWEQAESDKNAALDTVTKKQSVSFLDDPLTWLSNKLTVNTDIAQYNDKEQKADSLYDQLQKINTLNSDTAKSMQAIAQTQTAATVKATTDAALQKTQIAADDARLKGILYNVQGLKDTTQLGQDAVDNSVKATQTAIEEGHLAVAQGQLTVMTRELNLKADEYQQTLKDKQNADATDAYVADQVNKGRAAAGFGPLPPAKIFAMWKLNDPSVKDFYTAGATTDAIGKTVLAPTAGGAARILADSRSPLGQANPAVKSVTDLLQDSYNGTIQSAKTNPNLDVKNKESLETAVSGVVNQRVQSMAADIKYGDQSNIFQAPPLTALATRADVKSNPLYTKVLAPQIKSGMAETDPNKIMSLTVDAINQGQISITDAAAGMQQLFNSAVNMNVATKDYMRFGIAPQAHYVTTVGNPGVFGDATKVDMTDKAQVTSLIMKSIAARVDLMGAQ